MAGVPVHVPVLTVSNSPSRVVPVIAGAAVLTGGVAATWAEGAEEADVAPAAFVAVTTARIVEPTSAAPRA
jgi:hypothetical protein